MGAIYADQDAQTLTARASVIDIRTGLGSSL
jgi:hypothetical protein